ncbi:ABC transporter substrate-binding protein [Plastorhodobacter daqingensis]|uniref:ABC transporter substrate-binding protein n=1 Tax=Plastorhodobacter daqingensis TaxID=1387281 RepID=A0ABW2UGL0_9RHOB
MTHALAGAVALGATLDGGAAAAGPFAPEPPRRVLSMNLCTDQLALLVAAPGQLISVSYLSHDPRSSVMAAEAAALPANHGLAEDIVLMRPDLVLAGQFTHTGSTAMLQRLGARVEVFAPDESLEDIRSNLRRMGILLGREEQAEAVIARFDADLAALASMPAPALRTALYAANGYSPGDASLAGSILRAAGLVNVAADLGLGAGGFLMLEDLLLSDPDLLVLHERHSRPSRAEEVLTHPALRALTAHRATETMADSDWICGTPYVARAIARLRATARDARK